MSLSLSIFDHHVLNKISKRFVQFMPMLFFSLAFLVKRLYTSIAFWTVGLKQDSCFKIEILSVLIPSNNQFDFNTKRKGCTKLC